MVKTKIQLLLSILETTDLVISVVFQIYYPRIIFTCPNVVFDGHEKL